MRPRVSEAERERWADLAARYRFSYAMSLQQRLETPAVHIDITRWWGIGGKRANHPYPEAVTSTTTTIDT